MCLIFSASSDPRSTSHTSRFIGPVVRWFIPNISEEALGQVVFAVRKSAHVTEYAIMAWLVWRALRKPVRNDARPWEWSKAWIALAFTALYAASDEIHQLFVPTREARFGDVLLDSAGAALGLLLVWSVCCWRRSKIEAPAT